jgi:hypothetical protein
MSNDTSVPTFSPKNYKDTFQVDLFHLTYIPYPLVALQKRTVTSQFAEYVPLLPPVALSSPKLSLIKVHVKKHPKHPWTV